MESVPQRSILSEARVGRIVLLCVLAGFLSLVAAVAVTGWAIERNLEHAAWVEHTYQVESRIAAYRLLVERAEVQRRGYLLSQETVFNDNFAETMKALPPALEAMRTATIDNPRQQARIARIDRITTRHTNLQRASMAMAAVDPGAARKRFDHDGAVDYTRAIRRYCDAMILEERGLLAIRTAAQRQGTRLVFAGLTLCAVLLAVVALLSVTVIRRYTRDLRASRDALEQLNASLEERVVERTRDLTLANEEIQRFAYIVSHDLRSPLVNVMGFTGELEAAAKPLAALVDAAEAHAPELLTEDARLAAREDLPESIRFIRTSTQKMDRLINAILRLSREGRRVLAPQEIDLAGLLDATVATLRHRLDEIGAEIVVRRPMPALVADRLAVEQMLSNLLENAVKYLQPGRPGRIEVSARVDRGRVAVAVADNGRGIDPRDHERIFDLFRRSGQQDQPGEGIGLAHVRALAYRLGGLIEVASTLGEGATFTLSLPAVPASKDPS